MTDVSAVADRIKQESAFLQDGQSMLSSAELEQPASKVVFTVKNVAGQLVHRHETGIQPAGMVDFEWDGLDANGNRLPGGQYQIAAEVHRGSEVEAGKMFTVVDVESVTLGVGGQDLTLSVSGLGDIDMSQVRKIM